MKDTPLEAPAGAYLPLDYAWQLHALYFCRYGAEKKRVVFLGMNPGSCIHLLQH